MLRFVDLFAGIGGIRLGFEQAMWELGIDAQCVLSSEIDQRAQETYQLNFGERPQGDIYGINDFPPFDFMLAGFPCQPFSYAGKQQGFVDTRGTLFFEIERLLRDHRPMGFLLENVRGLTSHDQGRTFATIIEKLKALDYGVSFLILNSSNFGIPQNRVRVYIVGLDKTQPKLTLQSDLGAADSHKFKDLLVQTDLFYHYPSSVVADILESNPDSKYDGKKLTLDEIKTFFDHKDIDIIIQGLLEKGYLKEADGRYNPVAGNMSFEVFKFLDPTSISITLVTSDAHKLGVVHNGRVRRITPRECARLQGFPDSFQCHPLDVYAYRQFGNSVSMPVVRNVIFDLFSNSEISFRANQLTHKSKYLCQATP